MPTCPAKPGRPAFVLAPVLVVVLMALLVSLPVNPAAAGHCGSRPVGFGNAWADEYGGWCQCMGGQFHRRTTACIGASHGSAGVRGNNPYGGIAGLVGNLLGQITKQIVERAIACVTQSSCPAAAPTAGGPGNPRSRADAEAEHWQQRFETERAQSMTMMRRPIAQPGLKDALERAKCAATLMGQAKTAGKPGAAAYLGQSAETYMNAPKGAGACPVTLRGGPSPSDVKGHAVGLEKEIVRQVAALRERLQAEVERDAARADEAQAATRKVKTERRQQRAKQELQQVKQQKAITNQTGATPPAIPDDALAKALAALKQAEQADDAADKLVAKTRLDRAAAERKWKDVQSRPLPQ